MSPKIQKSKAEWKQQLTEEQYQVLREKGTEAPFTGKYVDTTDEGVYVCAACKTPLFSSKTKYHSGSGWPSFYDVLDQGNVELKPDNTHGMERTEVVCATCGSHLGHLFDDGPTETTGLRYCSSSAALTLDQSS